MSCFGMAAILFLLLSCEKQDGRDLYDPIINPTSEYFVVLGDIQEYTHNDALCSYYRKTLKWIDRQSEYYGNIRAILVTGDLTWQNAWAQWLRFYEATYPIAEDNLFISCIGNHDYTENESSQIESRNDTMFSTYTSFGLTEQCIVARYEEGRMENVIVRCDLADGGINVLVLEFGPRREVIEWANSYVVSHPDEKFILLTHEYLTREGRRNDSGFFSALTNTSASSPEYVWQNLVKYNDNVLCVLCGHNGFYTHLTSVNAYGREVPQILFNLQYQVNGGDGMVQLWEFPEDSDYVNVSIYNTISRKYITTSQISFKYKY